MNMEIDAKSHIPIYKQIIDTILLRISSQRMHLGDKLPSVRSLAADLDINPATVVRAYRELEEMGFIKTKRGSRATIISLSSGTAERQLLDLYGDFLFKARKMGYSEKEILDIISRHALNALLICDVGSTTTKGILFKRDGGGRMVCAGYEQCRTTVESPEEDVWIGLMHALSGLEDKTNWRILEQGRLLIPATTEGGIDLFLATSSAGGGLQMITAGLVKYYTGESAERTALGAGAVVMDVLSIDDGRTPYEKIMALKDLKPDIILLSGGVEGGAISGVVQLGEILASSALSGKFGAKTLPLVYAGNSNAQEYIRIALEKQFDLSLTENIRPDLKSENPLPARKEILRIFMDHVMKMAPGYERLTQAVSSPILPTPGAVFELLRKYSEGRELNILSFDVGGATTDVFSTYQNEVTRTVSANLGMSYSLLQAMHRAEVDTILQWIPFEMDRIALMDIAANRMVSPASLAQNKEEQEMEIAVAKEIFRMAFDDHRELAASKEITDKIALAATGKKAKKSEWNTGRTTLDPLAIDMIIGSGGILSHSSREKAFEIMLDGFESKGITELYVDSIFMMPHLGVLASVNPALALELFENECLVLLATVISPAGNDRKGKIAFTLKIGDRTVKVRIGDFIRIPVEQTEIEVRPTRRFDAGAGKGISVKRSVKPGLMGIVCDMRERPLHPDAELVAQWRKAMHGGAHG